MVVLTGITSALISMSIWIKKQDMDYFFIAFGCAATLFTIGFLLWMGIKNKSL